MTRDSDLELAVAAHCGQPMVTKWVLVAEVIEKDGSRTLKVISSPDIPGWDKVGMLQTATGRAYSRMMR